MLCRWSKILHLYRSDCGSGNLTKLRSLQSRFQFIRVYLDSSTVSTPTYQVYNLKYISFLSSNFILAFSLLAFSYHFKQCPLNSVPLCPIFSGPLQTCYRSQVLFFMEDYILYRLRNTLILNTEICPVSNVSTK